MKTVLFVVVLFVGLFVLAQGYDASEGFDSEISEFFRGRPTQEAMTLLITGAVLSILGAGGLVLSSRRR
jgi:hypothetical protein